MSKNKKVFFSNSGTRIVPKYIRFNDEDGMPIMKVKEYFNLYDDIQTYKDDNDIYKILARVSGDISKLDFNKGIYIDVTKIPNNYNDLMNMSSQIKSDYDSLPIKYKEKLKNNFNIFYGLAMQGVLPDFIKAVDSESDVNKMLKGVNFNFNNKPVGDSNAELDKNVESEVKLDV